MAEPAKKEPEGGPGYGARAIVICYALGIVAIGAKPLFQDYDTILRDIRATTHSLRKEVPKIRRGQKAETEGGTTAKDEPPTVEAGKKLATSEKDATAKTGNKAAGAAKDEKSGNDKTKGKPVDHLTPTDRQQLNKLLSDL